MQSRQAASRKQDRAIPLVVQTEGRKYTVSEQALQLIAQVEGTLSIVVVCGAYRTGKSYLINRVLLGRSDGFGVGSTIDACTKGLWMWSKVLKCQDYLGVPTNLLIIDSEGLSSCDQDGTADSNLFALSVLLSSLLIYNSMGAIDEGSIDCLAVVSHISKLLQGKVQGEAVPAEGSSPDFYWVLRDFSLQLLLKYICMACSNGTPITEDEYLENSLKSNKSSSDEHNKIRKALMNFFPNRHCCSLIRPTTSQTDLQNLDRIELENLRAEFVEQVFGLRRKVLSSLKPKQLNGKKLTGENFCELLTGYISAINRGALPNIENTWMHVCRSECQHALSDCTTQFQNWIEEILGQLPLSEKDFDRAEKEVKRSIIHMFSQRTVGNELAAQHLKELKKVVKCRLDLLADQNSKELIKHCRQFLEKEFKHVEAKVQRGQISTVEELLRQIDLFGEFLSSNYPYASASSDKTFSSYLKDRTAKYSVEFSRKLQVTIESLNQQVYEQKGQLKSLNTELNHLKEVEIGNYITKIAELESSLDLQRFQSMEFKLTIDSLRQEAITSEERTLKLQAEKSELKRVLQETKLRVTMADEERYTAKQELEILRVELATGKTLNDNKIRFYEELKEEFSKKQKSFQNDLRRLQSQLEQKSKQLSGKLEACNRRHLQTIEQLEAKLEVRSNDLTRTLQERNEIESRYLTEISEKNEKIFNLSKEIKDGKFKRTNQLEDSMRCLQKYLATVRKELSQEQDRSRKIKKELDAKSSTAIELEQQRNELKVRLNDRSSREVLDRSMTNLQDVNTKLEHQSRSLKENIEELESKNTLMTKQYEAELAELNDQLGRSEQTKKQLLQQLAQSTKQKDDELIKEYESRIVELQSQLQKRAESLSEVKVQEREEYQLGINSLKEVYSKERQGWEAAHQQERRRSEREIESLGHILNEKEDQISELVNTCTQLNKELKSKTEELARATQNLSTSEKELSQLRHQLVLDQKLLEELRTRATEIQEKLSSETTKNDELRNRNLISDTKLEEQKAELMRLSKQNIILKGKQESLQNQLKRKKHVQEERQLDDERNELQQKYEQLRTKYQRTCEEFMTSKSSLEKDLALSLQNTEFINRKYEDCRVELGKLNAHMDETIRSQKNEALFELKEQLDSRNTELEMMERKHEKLKKSLKELESSYLRQVNNLEGEKNKLQEILTGAMKRNEQLMAFHEQESIYSNSRMSCLEEKLHLTSDMQGLEYDRLKRENEELRSELGQLQQDRQFSQARFEVEELLRNTIDTLKRQLEEANNDRQLLLERQDAALTEQRCQKKHLRQQLSQLELKFKAAERCQKRNRMERVSQSVLLEQIDMLKKQRDEYLASSRRDYHQLNELMTRKLDEMEKKVQAEEATNKRLRMELDKQTTCFNLSKENLKDRINQLTLTNDLLAQEVEALKRSPTGVMGSPRSKYRFRLEDTSQT